MAEKAKSSLSQGNKETKSAISRNKRRGKIEERRMGNILSGRRV